jgi:RNA polymerase sigma-70 factor (ECF subfamily)
MTERPRDEGGDAPAARPDSAAVVTALVANHRDFLAFLERRVGDRALAEDILQDAFVRGLDKVAALRDHESLVPWFYRVLRNAVVDHYRRRSTATKALADFAVELDRPQPDVETHATLCTCVRTLAETLKPEYAQALRRVELEDVAVKDYALEAGITSTNAGVRVFRAREALRRRVQESCGTCATHGCRDCTCGRV